MSEPKILELEKKIDDFIDLETEVEITDEIEFDETIANTHFYKKGNMVYFLYQGQGKTHSAGDVLFTVPSKYKPKYQTHFPFVKNNQAYGTVSFSEVTGIANVNMISSSANGRIYINGIYTIA